MANHKSAEKRARQALVRKSRNNRVRSQVRTAEKAVRTQLSDQGKSKEALQSAFSVIQKARGVLHKNTIRRKMARLSKAVAQIAKGA